ncbi:MAG: hypothetical protein FJ245_06455 [Nitrospira sp.]|nr:hypothetical protein [Nitrospira sp.]
MLAAILSGLMPGLGQFYCRQWGTGAALLIAGLVIDGALGVSVGLIGLVQGLAAGAPPQDSWAILLRALPLLALSIWSILDAAKTARRFASPASLPGTRA